MSGVPLEVLAERARGGDRDALEELVERIQQPLFALATRMLWHPEDARDATQDILVRIVTHLASFRGESRFMTWAYRVASNYLLTCRRSRVEREEYSFERFSRELEAGIGSPPPGDPWPADRATLLEELKVGCMLGMLTCLDRESRLAYVLGEILELEAPEAANVLGITPVAFRKRLSRARAALVAFTRAHCGLVDAENPCRCDRRLPEALRHGRVDPNALLFADPQRASSFPDVLRSIEALDHVRRTVRLYRTHSEPRCGPEILERINEVFGD